MPNPEHETVIVINTYDGMTPAQRKEADKGLPPRMDQDYPPFFVFGTSKASNWRRMLRKVGGKNNLIRFKEGALWYEGLIPLRYLSKMTFGIRAPRRKKRPNETKV